MRRSKDMWGTIVNVIAIIVGGFLGKILGKGLPGNIRSTVMQAIGLGVLLIGIQMALSTQNITIVIISMVLGGIMGEVIKLQSRLDDLGLYLESKFSKEEGDNTFARAFVTASLVCCVGAMAIMGALESGLTGQHQTLYAKSILDGVSAIMFSSTLGIGVAFAAIPVFIYQGLITLLASWVQGFMTVAVIAEMKATGGLLILGIGLNLLKIADIKVGNLLPAILIAAILASFF
jgi:uncharacterized membrane protein YqgA involved in biofilm formation